MESWEPHLPGGAIGFAAGALPPEGFYFVDTQLFINSRVADAWGIQNSQEKLFCYVNAPTVLWATGCKIFGADYGVALTEALVWTDFRVGTGLGPYGPADTGDQWGLYNTVFNPGILSWKLPCDFRVKVGIPIFLDDGYHTVNDGLASITKIGPQRDLSKDGLNIYAPSAIGSTVFAPNVGISWLSHGFNLSADMWYGVSLKNTNIEYQSGDMFEMDLTGTYTCGKWTFGGGAAFALQLQDDKYDAGDGTGYHSQPNSKETLIKAGPLIGYNFGPVSFFITCLLDVETKNAVFGNDVIAQIIVPLGGKDLFKH
jgi:hypothetical protein